jgi:hypothetical protein
MPFSDVAMPSIALTQLKSVIQSRFKERVSVQIIYANHDFAKFIGLEIYEYISNSMESLNTGLGDWLFRQVAFPELPDNTAAYLRRCFPQNNSDVTPFDEAACRDFAYYFADQNIAAEYQVAMATWIDSIRARVERWKALWDISSLTPPRLCFAQDRTRVYDSRSGSVVEHLLTKTGRAILDLLSRPLRIEDLLREFSSQPSVDIPGEIESLQERGLVFQENGRMLSLLLDGELLRMPRPLGASASSGRANALPLHQRYRRVRPWVERRSKRSLSKTLLSEFRRAT